ncbi:outer membrane protein N [Aeromonas sp. RU39B]|uniref:porin n=1 Tax=Aeromonas sp. RU39B TaxID=1907416 RepID=UPI0009544207|nr:porin [Aeromonas sp. RU39B]SIQ17559.1 outer membrane protein N [Aeromonas sp. RU39B]
MKKTILAIAIPALFASAAHATVVYDKDGTTFDIYGRVQANYYSDRDDTDSELKAQTRLGWSGKIALNNTWSAIAKTEWQVAAENSGYKTSDIDARHIYAGFDGSQYGKIIFGQTDTAYYMGVLEKTDIAFEDGSEANRYDSRQEGQAIYMGKWGGLFANASYQTKDSSQAIDHGYAASLGYDFDFGLGLSVGGERKEFSGADQLATDADTYNYDKKDDWAVAASFTKGPFYVAGMYNQSKVDYLNDEQAKFRGYEFFGNYSVDAWTFELGYNFSEQKDAKTTTNLNPKYEDVADYTYLGVQYAFTPKLKTWTEYKIVNVDNKDDQWTVGLQYNF